MTDLTKYNLDTLFTNTLKGTDADGTVHHIWKGDQTLDGLPVFKLFYALAHNEPIDTLPDVTQTCSRFFCVSHLKVSGYTVYVPDKRRARHITYHLSIQPEITQLPNGKYTLTLNGQTVTLDFEELDALLRKVSI